MWRRRAQVARLVVGAGVLAAIACGRDEQPPAAGGQAASRAASGQAIYEARCSACHGLDGGGNGPAAAAITPRPRNFHDPAFWQGRTDAQLRLVVKQGKPGTLMAPFEGVLSDAEIDDVVAYLHGFRPAGS